jgi:hypothetical protein
MPVASVNLMVSKVNQNYINFFSIDCQDARYGDQKIFCTSFNIRIEDKLSEKQKEGEELREKIKELRESGVGPFCEEKSILRMDQLVYTYDKVNAGEEVIISGNKITKEVFEDIIAASYNHPIFGQMVDVNIFEMFRNIRNLCENNAAGLRKKFEGGLIRGFENEKKTAKIDFWPSRMRQEYMKDFQTGAFYFERTKENDCFRYYQRDEIRFDKDMLKLGIVASISEYEENVVVLDMLRSDSKCLDLSKAYSKKIIWRVGQSLELPPHWKFFEVAR